MLLGRKARGTVGYLGGLPALLEPFAWSWGQLCAYNAEFMSDEKSYVHMMRATFSDHGPARNSLVRGFLGDWLVQLDTDHQFEPDLVDRLVRTADEFDIDVLSGVYQLKNPPHIRVLYQWVKIGDGIGLQPIANVPDDARIIQIGSAGGGCLFVRRSVFDQIVDEFKCGPFDKTGIYSEDHSFFSRCKQLGIKCYAALNIESNHLRTVPVTLDDFDDTGIPKSELFAVEGY